MMTLPCPKPARPENTPPRQEEALNSADAERIARYTPKLPDDVWAEIGDFVRSAVTDCAGRVPYTVKLMLGTATPLAAWCHHRGLPLERTVVLDRHTIALFIERGCEGMAHKSRQSMRSALMRMGRTLAPQAHTPALPRISTGPAPVPYSRTEQAALRSWVSGGRTKYRREQSALLLALGVGAGLQRADVEHLLVKHVTVDSEGVLVEIVGGRRPRVVPVLRDWEEAIADIVNSGRDPGEHLLLPRAKSRSRNLTNTQNVYGTGAPSTSRMRATWIVRQLAAGIPTRALLDAAGVEHLEAFNQYLRFVPDPDPMISRRLLRGEVDPT